MTESPKSAIKKRPLSPHIQIYKPQITSVLSILHRATGIILFGGTIIWALWLNAIANGPETYNFFQGFFLHPIGIVVLMGWSFSAFYHLCNGLRHLMWDAGYGYDMSTVRKTGWWVISVTAGLSLLTWVMGYVCWENSL